MKNMLKIMWEDIKENILYVLVIGSVLLFCASGYLLEFSPWFALLGIPFLLIVGITIFLVVFVLPWMWISHCIERAKDL